MDICIMKTFDYFGSIIIVDTLKYKVLLFLNLLFLNKISDFIMSYNILKMYSYEYILSVNVRLIEGLSSSFSCSLYNKVC